MFYSKKEKSNYNKHHDSSYGITTRQIITVFIGFSIVACLLLSWLANGSERFFLQYIRFRGRYLNEAYVFVIGLVILGFGLFDILKSKKKRSKR